MSSKRSDWWVLIAIIGVLGGVLLLPPRDGIALLHNQYPDLSGVCDDCHTLNSLLQEPNTSLIRAGVRTLPTMKSKNGATPPAAFGCTFCHFNDGRSTYMRDSLDHFAGKPSQHPVDRGYTIDSARRTMTLSASTNTTRWMSNWDNSWGGLPSNQIGCVYCHDVANPGYASTTGVPQGYPNHIATDNALRTVNPFMLRGGSASWNGTDNHATNAFCLGQCHDGSTPAKVPYKMGHYGWGSFDNGGTLGTLKEHNGTALKTSRCVDCHETHYSTMKTNLMGEAGETARTSISQANQTVDVSNCVNICHSNTRFVAWGHGKAGVNQACSSCHTSSVSHRDPANVRRFSLPALVGDATLTVDLSTNGLDDNFDGVVDDPGEATMAYSGLSVCQTCHSDKNIHQGAIAGNITTSGQSAGCLHCHDPHGNGTDNNLKMIRRNLMPGNKTVYYWTDKADYLRGDNNSLCDNPACHGKSLGNTSTPGTIMYDIPDHRDTPGMGANYNCSQCHNHSSTTGATSFSAKCNSCHTYPGQTVVTDTHVLSAVHDIHISPDPAGYGFSCGLCHYQNNHNPRGLSDPLQWATWVLPTDINIRFDPSWNPPNVNGPRYNGVPADNGSAPAPGTTPSGAGTCAGLYCHGNSVAALVWSGSTTTPKWDNAASGACGTCHRATASVGPTTFAHPKHVDSATGYGIGCSKCHYATTADNVTIVSKGEHMNRQSRVSYPTGDPLLGSGSYNGNPATVGAADGTMQCANIYCHNPGTRFTANYDNGALGVPGWNGGVLACNACHGQAGQTGPTVGMPAYPNGSTKINSHDNHVSVGYGCQVCHFDTTTDGTTVPQAKRVNHVNGVYNLAPDNASHSFGAYVSPNCSALVCHGGNAAPWGGSLQCGNCHLAATDSDQYQVATDDWFNNGTTGTLDNTEWIYSGHGKASTQNYDVSDQAGAGFIARANGGDPCYYCHDAVVGHKETTNPFRLKRQTGVSGYETAGWNATCLICHSKSQNPPGYAPTGGAYTNIIAAADDRVDTAHYGSPKHATDNTGGGYFCWDCHDAHGDRSNSTTGNIYMIQKVALAKTDGTYGYRGSLGENTALVTFQRDNTVTANGDWARGDFKGICQVCHHGSGLESPTQAKYYTPSAFMDHNKDQLCISCHSHDKNFGSSCNGCHGSSVSGQYWPDGSGGNPAYADNNAGAHDNHVLAISRYKYSQNIAALLSDPATDNRQKAICGFCHPNPGGSGHSTDNTDASTGGQGRVDVFGAGLFRKFIGSTNDNVDPTSGAYAYDNLSCSNLACHNQVKTPEGANHWNNPPALSTATPQAGGSCAICHTTGSQTQRHDVHTVSPKTYACTECHADHATTPDFRHGNGLVDLVWNNAGSFERTWGDNAVTYTGTSAYKDGSWGTCSGAACHNSRTTPSWSAAVSPPNCTVCHTENRSNLSAIADPGSGVHVDNASFPEVTGHDNSFGPGGAYTCTDCHASNPTDNHVNGVRNTPATATYGWNMTNKTITLNVLGNNADDTCAAACHSDGGAWKRLWDNAAYSDNAAVGATRCNVCHGQWSSLAGSKGWRDNTSHYNVSGSPASTRGKTHDAAPENCDQCHAYATVTGKHNTATHRITMNDNDTLYARGTGGSSAYAGCTKCHGGPDDAGKRIPISVFASEAVIGPHVVGAACNACHSYPGLGSGSYAVTMSAVHAKHVGTVASTAGSKSYGCDICHFDYSSSGAHNQSQVGAGDSWPAGYNDNVSVRFDASLNPSPGAGLPSYGGVNATTGYAPGSAIDNGVCAGLYCHGGNGNLNVGWGGIDNTPKWDNTTAITCGDCHKTDSTLPQGNHPAHLASTFGPMMGSGNCYGTGGCHTDYGLTPSDSHAKGGATFRTSSGNAAATDKTGTLVCNNCHTAYVNAPPVPTAGATLGKANWDNSTYKLPCVTCHTGGTGTQASANIDNTGNRAHNIEETYYAKGHGDTSIDNGSTGSAPPVACTACHDSTVGHIGANRPTGTNPWRLLASTNFSTNGGLDAFCAGAACHSGSPPANHTWNVFSGETRTTQPTDTHPTSTASVRTDMGRWYQVADDANIPLRGNLTDNNYVKTAAGEIVCVSCHDPHGVGATAIPPAVRTFSGMNTEAADNNNMVRFNYKSGSPAPLCAKCHK